MLSTSDSSHFTCIKFEEDLETTYQFKSANVLNIITSNSCRSNVGRHQTKLNYLSLDMAGCGIRKQNILHEAMHVLGFVHEQSRPDYKKHIKLFRNNIRADAFKDNFRAVRKSRQNIMTPYDCASIIHQFF